MVLPISGFLPVPLPMMIPFMGAQSLVIGKMFGEGFQYGKRKISAMPNEEFNKLTFETMMSNARDEMQKSIPTMIQAMQDMKPMVQAVVHEFTNYLSLVIQAAPEQAEQIISSAAHALAPHDQPQIPAGHSAELNIFQAIEEQFPHVHEAFGTDLGGGFPLGKYEDTEAKRIALQKEFNFQFKRQQELLAVKIQAQIRKDARDADVSKFQSISEKASVKKRKAGQSQKLERKKLIGDIATWQRNSNKWPSSIQNARVLKHFKEKLAILLQRYQF